MRLRLLLPLVVVCATLTACSGLQGTASAAQEVTARPDVPAGQYVNPLPITTPTGATVESCPDPSIIRGQPGDNYWYLYCTNERFTDYAPVHLLLISKSSDLVHWTYVGDVFQRLPSWVASDAGLWAPDIQYFNGRYYLYYAASKTSHAGSAIFVATSASPVGPWTASPTPVVEPQSCCGGSRDVIDPAIVEDGGQRYIFYGSFHGGIAARRLSADGMTSDSASEVPIATSDRYEAPYVIKRNGSFYLMVSSGPCCAGLLTGYSVFVGKSPSVLGPYLDKDGNSLLDSRVGGTPVLQMNGNRWLGPGHNAVVADASGQDWIIYHAVDVNKPVFADSWTRRPAMMDRLDWSDGWPVARGGSGPSDTAQSAPALDASATVQADPDALADPPGAQLAEYSVDFQPPSLSPQWQWIRPDLRPSFSLNSGQLAFATQAGDLYLNSHSASVLAEPAPAGDYIVEVKLSNDVPPIGDFNFSQTGLVIYTDDNNYIKLVVAAINGTRQIEFAKQYAPFGYAQYGHTFLSSPDATTYLRIHKRSSGSQETYTAASSHDGLTWEPGPTWTHNLGSGARIGLVSMSGAGFTSYFDYVPVYGGN